MATVQTLIDRLNYAVNDTVDPNDALMLFNQCQEDISPDAGYAITATATIQKGTSKVEMPSDLIDLVEIRMLLDSWKAQINPALGNDGYRRLANVHVIAEGDTANDTWYLGGINGFEWFGDTITIRPTPLENGTLEIKYYAMLPALTSAKDANGNYSDVPVFKAQFHDILVAFAAWKWSENWKDVPNEVAQFMNQYNAILARMQDDTMWRKERTSNRTVYKMRGWR